MTWHLFCFRWPLRNEVIRAECSLQVIKISVDWKLFLLQMRILVLVYLQLQAVLRWTQWMSHAAINSNTSMNSWGEMTINAGQRGLVCTNRQWHTHIRPHTHSPTHAQVQFGTYTQKTPDYCVFFFLLSPHTSSSSPSLTLRWHPARPISSAA